MTYAIGDPDHIEVHESIRLLFMAAGLDPDLIPGTATIGATGHVDDHNKIADALAWIDAEGILGVPSPIVSGTTGSPATSTVTLGGVSGTLYNFGANGSITCSRAGRARAVIIGGASSDSGPNYGNVGMVFDGWIDLPASATTITVGATGWAGSAGGGSSVGTIAAAPGGDAAVSSAAQRGGAGRGFVGAATTDGYSSNITGLAVVYGKEGSSSTYGSRTGPTPTAGRVFIFVPD